MKAITLLLSIPLVACVVDPGDELDPESQSTIESEVALESAPNANGSAETRSRTGNINRANVFFKVRPNGRSCETCHNATAGWGVTPALAQSKFASNPTDSLFQPFDASSNPFAGHGSVQEKQLRYRALLNHGLIRFDTNPQSPLPANTDIIVTNVHDDSGYGGWNRIPRYRRASSIANEWLAQTMSAEGIDAPARALLVMISGGASAFHLGTTITETEQGQMADFMQSLVHAQSYVNGAGRTDADGAKGGVSFLANQSFVPGANDPTKAGFNQNVFQLYGAWLTSTNPTRAAIARGERVFNTKPLFGVHSLFPAGARPSGTTTCSTCHAVPNVGNHPVFRVFDIGTAEEFRSGSGYLPRVTVESSTTFGLRTVTDLGHALRSGKWSDVGKFAVPKLRGLSSRAPYFHDGTAPDLRAVVQHYEHRFSIAFTASEREDLIAFLSAL